MRSGCEKVCLVFRLSSSRILHRNMMSVATASHNYFLNRHPVFFALEGFRPTQPHSPRYCMAGRNYIYMSTQSQIDANRLNATKSTGPSSSEGKSASAKNALISGLFTTHDFVLPDEAALYKNFFDTMFQELCPARPPRKHPRQPNRRPPPGVCAAATSQTATSPIAPPSTPSSTP